MTAAAPMARALSQGATFALLMAGGWLALGWPQHPDVAFYTTAARQLADGAELYVDIGDTNPPTIYWLHGLLHWLAGRTGFDDKTTLVLAYLGVAGACLLWTGRLLREAAPMAALLLPPSLAAALTVAALGSFGEREHWAVPLLLPYLATVVLAALGQAAGRRAEAAAGLLAALAVLLKPPLLGLVLLLPELWLAWHGRRWSSLRRTAPLVLIAAVTVGGALLLAVHPRFLAQVLPDVASYYAVLGRPLGELLSPRGVWLPLALLAAALSMAPSLGRAGVLARPFLWGAAGAALAAVLQGKGFAYHWLPAVMLALAGILVLLATAEGWRRLLALPLLLLPLWIGFLGWQQARGGEGAWPAARDLASALRPGERVFALNPELYPLFPAVTVADARWVGSEATLWRLNGYYQRHPAPQEARGFRPPERQDSEETLLRRSLVERFLASRPDLVAVFAGDATPTIGGNLDYLAYLLADADFAAGWQDYRLDGRIGEYDLYRRQAR